MLGPQTANARMLRHLSSNLRTAEWIRSLTSEGKGLQQNGPDQMNMPDAKSARKPVDMAELRYVTSGA